MLFPRLEDQCATHPQHSR